ncbi:MAG TPA: hypothetical protein VFG20_23060 [Planctomycetaceae bacterium]|nr:hypothetical protein [Planctomycetaceae bacterium]
MTDTATTHSVAETALPGDLPSAKQSAFLFWLAVVWLLALGGALHVFDSMVTNGDHDARLLWIFGTITAVLWPFFLLEAGLRFRGSVKNRAATVSCLFLPALRLGLRDPASASYLWLPGCGWQHVDESLQERVEKWLRGPMLVVSLAVLPLLAAEHFAAHYIAERPALKQAAVVATAMIWWAFTVEFILMVSITNQKLKYVKAHWLDLVIILLPLVSFLQALRLSRLARLQQLTKTTRLYRFRGVAMKTYRALLLIDVVARLLQGAPEKRLVKLREQLEERESELALLRRDIAKLEAQLASAAECLPVAADLIPESRGAA